MRTWGIVGGLTLFAVVGLVAFLVLRPDPVNDGITGLPGEATWARSDAPGTQVATTGGGDHTTNVNEKVAYNSNPPTSGRHYFQWTDAGPKSQTVPDTVLVHNLEHGYVIINYSCPKGCPTLADKLNQIALSYPKVITNPRLDAALPRISLTAWGHTDTFNLYNEDRIKNFISVWMNNKGAPEWNVAP